VGGISLRAISLETESEMLARIMVWYPSVDDVIDMNVNALDLSRDKYPYKMLGSVERIQTILERVREVEGDGLAHQAALIMKEFADAQIFAGANHRTGYGLAKMFLRRNGKRLRVDDLKKRISVYKEHWN
jgi:prophage maintenance system killer protein